MTPTKFTLNNVFAKKMVIRMLTVRSYEMNIYLVELEVGEQKGLVYQDDRPRRFSSSQHIRDTFDGYQVLAAQMLHESPYDEMIGNPESAQSAGLLPFSMAQPY
jgi:hypothetical protein